MIRSKLVCLLGGASALLGADLPHAVLPEGVGVNIHFTRGHERDLDLLATVGFRLVRMDFSWSGTERERGRYDWSAYDELTRNLETRNLRALYILDYSNALYEETVATRSPINGREQRATASPQHPASVAAFARWAGEAVRHFRGHRIVWEVWNEPNIHFWKPEPDVRQYTPLLLATARAIRQADPDATLIAPATSGFPWEFLESLFQAGALEHLDAVSVHPYRRYRLGPETAAADYARLRQLIARHTPPGKRPLPVVSGEWGYATHTKGISRETQAAFLVRQQLVNLLHGVPLSIWYDWQDDGPDPAEPEHNFGVVTQKLELKPAGRALRTMTRQLAGHRIVRRLPLGADADHALWCVPAAGEGPGRLVVWTTGKAHPVEVALPPHVPAAGARAVDGYGQPQAVEIHDGKLSLTVAPLPAYVSWTPKR